MMGIAEIINIGFWVCIVSAIFLLFLCIKSVLKYRRDRLADDLHAAVAIGVTAIVIIGVNVSCVYPYSVFDSVRYVVVLLSEAPVTVILPIPDEPRLMSNIKVFQGNCTMKKVETSYGTGLQIDFNWTLRFEGAVISRLGSVNYIPDLMENSRFRIYIDHHGNVTQFGIHELRIVHQSYSDFHSKQVIYGGILNQGWNLVNYQIYPSSS
jgi:hypothetical protein